MARFEELEISADYFEPASSSRQLIVPIMNRYPSPKNTFDVFLGTDGNQGSTDGNQGSNVPWDDIAQIGGQVIGSAIQNQDETRKMLRQRCGRQPLLRKNRGEYNECREQFYRELQGLSGGGSLTNEQMLEILSQQRDDGSKKAKIGTAGVIGIVLGALAVGTAIYFVARKK